jgi:hypothetical protein
LKIEAEAQVGIYRLSCNVQLRPKSLWYRHMSRAQDMMRKPILQMGTDKMTPRYAFHKPFLVRLPDRSEWDRALYPYVKGDSSVKQMGPRQMRILEPWCMAVV